MYSLATKHNMDKIFSKLKKKNPKQLQIIFKKIEQIVETTAFHSSVMSGVKSVVLKNHR